MTALDAYTLMLPWVRPRTGQQLYAILKNVEHSSHQQGFIEGEEHAHQTADDWYVSRSPRD